MQIILVTLVLAPVFGWWYVRMAYGFPLEHLDKVGAGAAGAVVVMVMFNFEAYADVFFPFARYGVTTGNGAPIILGLVGAIAGVEVLDAFRPDPDA